MSQSAHDTLAVCFAHKFGGTDVPSHGSLVTDDSPLQVREHHFVGPNELLERPATLEPPAAPEAFPRSFLVSWDSNPRRFSARSRLARPGTI